MVELKKSEKWRKNEVMARGEELKEGRRWVKRGDECVKEVMEGKTYRKK